MASAESVCVRCIFRLIVFHPEAVEALTFACTAPEVERQIRCLLRCFPSLGNSGAEDLLNDLRRKTWERVRYGLSQHQVEFEFSPGGLWCEGADWWRKERREKEGRRHLYAQTTRDATDGEMGLGWCTPADDPETLLEERESDTGLVAALHAFFAARELKAMQHEKRIISDFRRALETDYDTMKELAAVLGYHPSSIGRSFRNLLEPFLASAGLEWSLPDCEMVQVEVSEANSELRPVVDNSSRGSAHKSHRRATTRQRHIVSDLKHRLAMKRAVATASKR